MTLNLNSQLIALLHYLGVLFKNTLRITIHYASKQSNIFLFFHENLKQNPFLNEKLLNKINESNYPEINKNVQIHYYLFTFN